MKILIIGLIVLVVLLQARFWIGDGGVTDIWRLQQAIDAQTEENRQLAERNQSLAAEVLDLKQGLEAIEERARNELGMIKQGETFYQVVQ